MLVQHNLQLYKELTITIMLVNNAIYMSGSSFQNELKEATPLYSSSLVAQIIPQGSSTTSYTPPGQTSLSIPLAPDNELWVYQGENNSLANASGVWANAGVDKNAWRYNRYIHRPFKIYYLTETGSGVPGTPYELYDPMSTSPNGQIGINIFGDPTYYDNVRRQFATMLGTQTDVISSAATPTYWRVFKWNFYSTLTNPNIWKF